MKIYEMSGRVTLSAVVAVYADSDEQAAPAPRVYVALL